MLMNVVWDFVNTGIQSVFLWIDSVIYWFASQCYQLFLKLAGARIFEDNFFANFANRIYVVLGVFMLFYLAYALLTAIVDPEKLTKGDKGAGKIATNLIVSLVILGFLPTIFSYAYRLQNYILASNVIGSLVLGTPPQEVMDENDNDDMLDYGDVLSYTVLNTFLNSDNINFNISDNYTWYNFKEDVLERGDYGAMPNMGKAVSTGVNALDGPNQGSTVRIDYKVVISTAAGIFLVYIMLSFTLDLGIRVVKFAFYQLIAPIPIIMRILPSKKGVFDKWLKQTLSVYFEVFVRVGIMYIAIYFINTIVNNDSLKQFWNGGLQGKLALVIIILGILAFAKQAPKMISEMLGIDTGGLKLGIKDKLKAGGFLGNAVNNGIGRVVGATTGAIGGGISGLANGAGAAGLLFGAANGWKGKGMQFGKQRQDMYSILTGDFKGRAGLFGGQSIGTRINNYMNDFPQGIAAEKRDEQMREFESQKLIQKEKEHNVQVATEKRAFDDHIASLQERFNMEKDIYDKETQNILNGLQDTYDRESEKFNLDKQNKLDALNLQLTTEEAQFNANKQTRLDALNLKLNTEEAQFTTDKQNKLAFLNAQYNSEKEKFENLKASKMKNLKIALETAGSEMNTIEYKKLENQILDLENTTYQNASLSNQIQQVENSHYENVALKEQIKQVENSHYENSALKDKIKQVESSDFDSAEGKRLLEQIEDASHRKYVNKELENEMNSQFEPRKFDADKAIDEIHKEYDGTLDKLNDKDYKQHQSDRAHLLVDRDSKKYHANVKVYDQLGESRTTKKQKEAFESVLKDLGYKKEDKK